MVCKELDENTGAMDEDDDAVVVTATKGITALRDMPHPRFSCATFKFLACGGPEAHTSNLNPCAQCFCWCPSAPTPTAACRINGHTEGRVSPHLVLQGV